MKKRQNKRPLKLKSRKRKMKKKIKLNFSKLKKMISATPLTMLQKMKIKLSKLKLRRLLGRNQGLNRLIEMLMRHWEMLV
jgi:hypothetical protein